MHFLANLGELSDDSLLGWTQPIHTAPYEWQWLPLIYSDCGVGYLGQELAPYQRPANTNRGAWDNRPVVPGLL